MRKPARVGGVAVFAAKFAVWAPVCLVAWWLLLPYYTWFLGTVGSALLKYIVNVPVDSFEVSDTGLSSPAGIMNTGTTLTIIVDGTPRTSSLGHLVNNVAPFVALLLATSGLTIRRRARIAAVGIGILVLGHIGFIVIDFVAGESEISTAIAQVCITLPFLLWIILAYWDKLAIYFADAVGGPDKPSPGE